MELYPSQVFTVWYLIKHMETLLLPFHRIIRKRSALFALYQLLKNFVSHYIIFAPNPPITEVNTPENKEN